MGEIPDGASKDMLKINIQRMIYETKHSQNIFNNFNNPSNSLASCTSASPDATQTSSYPPTNSVWLFIHQQITCLALHHLTTFQDQDTFLHPPEVTDVKVEKPSKNV